MTCMPSTATPSTAEGSLSGPERQYQQIHVGVRHGGRSWVPLSHDVGPRVGQKAIPLHGIQGSIYDLSTNNNRNRLQPNGQPE